MSADSRPSLPRRLWASPWARLLVVLAVLLALASPFALPWLEHRLTHSITDDAFVEAHLVNVAPQQVSGRLIRYLVQEHDTVTQGQLLAEIDPAPYRDQVNLLTARLAVAKAQLAAEQAALVALRARVPREIDVARKAALAATALRDRDGAEVKFTSDDVDKSVLEAQAGVLAAEATMVLAEADYKRFTRLGKEDAVSQRRAQEATRTYNASQAELKYAQARLARARGGRQKVEVARQAAVAADHLAQKADRALYLAQAGTLEVTRAEQLVEVKRQEVEQARRALQAAETDLKFTRLVAPFPGVVVHLYRRLGDFVPVGTPVLSMYNPELTYVTAQLEETKLQGVAPGNAVRLDIDAFAEPFRGRVVWVNRATGANFALVPRNISSGEFTKVVQRVPVRIAIDRDGRWPQLRAGLSVTVAIRHGPGDAAWARQEADRMRALAGGKPE